MCGFAGGGVRELIARSRSELDAPAPLLIGALKRATAHPQRRARERERRSEKRTLLDGQRFGRCRCANHCMPWGAHRDRAGARNGRFAWRGHRRRRRRCVRLKRERRCRFRRTQRRRRERDQTRDPVGLRHRDEQRARLRRRQRRDQRARAAFAMQPRDRRRDDARVAEQHVDQRVDRAGRLGAQIAAPPPRRRGRSGEQVARQAREQLAVVVEPDGVRARRDRTVRGTRRLVVAARERRLRRPLPLLRRDHVVATGREAARQRIVEAADDQDRRARHPRRLERGRREQVRHAQRYDGRSHCPHRFAALRSRSHDRQPASATGSARDAAMTAARRVHVRRATSRPAAARSTQQICGIENGPRRASKSPRSHSRQKRDAP